MAGQLDHGSASKTLPVHDQPDILFLLLAEDPILVHIKSRHDQLESQPALLIFNRFYLDWQVAAAQLQGKLANSLAIVVPGIPTSHEAQHESVRGINGSRDGEILIALPVQDKAARDRQDDQQDENIRSFCL